MKILYFNNGFGLGTAKSGGATRHIEIVKRFENMKINQNIVTTIGSKHLYKEEKIKSKIVLVKAAIFKKEEKNNFDRIIAYIISTIHSLIIIKKLPKAQIVYSTSDYFCDVIPSIAYRLTHNRSRMVAMIHHKCRSPFKRKGDFLINTISYIFQLGDFILIRFFADQILVYETPEGEKISDFFIKKGFKKKNISFVHNGIDLRLIKSVNAGSKKYEACFAGGLRASKGIFDLIPIWEYVTKNYNKKAKIAVAGGGTDKVTDEFRNKIKMFGLDNNIILFGALNKLELYKSMKRSKLFISTSHEEGWGIAVCEALACGIPIIAFDLPAFQIFRGFITGIPPYNYREFSERIIKTLKELPEKKDQINRRIRYVSAYDWNRIAELEIKLLANILK